MINVQVSIVIHQPLEEVFAFLSDLENNLKWRPGMIEARKISEGPIHKLHRECLPSVKVCSFFWSLAGWL